MAVTTTRLSRAGGLLAMMPVARCVDESTVRSFPICAWADKQLGTSVIQAARGSDAAAEEIAVAFGPSKSFEFKGAVRRTQVTGSVP
jgi:hypothetical protein